MQITPRTCLAGLLSAAAVALVAARADAACEYVDGHPVVHEAWLLDPDQTQSHIGDGSQLMLVAGTRLPDGRNAFWRDLLGQENMQFFPATEGLQWDDGAWVPECPGCGPARGHAGWFFGILNHNGYGPRANHGPLLVKAHFVDKDCFASDSGPGSQTMHVNPVLQYPVEVSAEAEYEWGYFCQNGDATAYSGPGYTGWTNAALTLAGFFLPGWGFGESFAIEQSGAADQPSRIVAHDGDCDSRPVSAVATGFAMAGGIVPANFVGPQSDAPTSFGNAGSYTSWTVPPEEESAENITVMAKQSEAICYLAGLGGKFVYDAELAEVITVYTADGPRWALHTRAYDRGSVWASANCYAYDQRTVIPGPSRPNPRPPGPIVPRPR